MKHVDIMGTSRRQRYNALLSDTANSPAEKKYSHCCAVAIKKWALLNQV
jgi:hypothetical protein